VCHAEPFPSIHRALAKESLMTAQGAPGSALGAAREAGESDTLEHLARVGLVAYGVVHLLVAWLALQLAWGGRSDESADQSGAMATLAEQPLGRPLLWVVAVGLIALAAWQAAELLRWVRGLSASGDLRKRAWWKTGKSLAKAVVYGALAATAIRFATGATQSSSESQQQTTGSVLAWPGGQWLVGAAGLALIAVGVQHVKHGVTDHFLKQIDTDGCSTRAVSVIKRLGRIGFPAKGVALGLVGGFLVWAAWTYDPEKATGLDGALHTVLTAPYGWALLTLIAVGIAAFGAFCFARARFPERN
jgi:hypothetical protein